MAKSLHPTLYWACDYLSMLVSKLIHVSKRGPGELTIKNTDKINRYRSKACMPILWCVLCTNMFNITCMFIFFVSQNVSVCKSHRWQVGSPHKEEWHGALMFSLMRVWINVWESSPGVRDLGRHGAHYDVTVMYPVQSTYLLFLFTVTP